MTLQEIKTSIENGQRVYRYNESYQVIKDNKDQYFIEFIPSNQFIGLTWLDGITLNGEEEHFMTVLPSEHINPL